MLFGPGGFFFAMRTLPVIKALLVQERLPSAVVGPLHMLAEYQWLAAGAIWHEERRAMVRALTANPLALSLSLAEELLKENAVARGEKR